MKIGTWKDMNDFFHSLYVNNVKVHYDIHIHPGTPCPIYIGDYVISEVYLAPEDYDKFNQYVIYMDKNYPLLAELR